MRRLYLRIYLAMLASLAVFALLTVTLWRLGVDGHEGPHEAASLAGELAAELLPERSDAPDAAAAAEALAERLQRWHTRTGMDLALFGADGHPIAQAGRPLSPPPPEAQGWTMRGGPPSFVARMPDGRRLVIHRPPPRGPWRGLAWPGFAVALPLLALAVGVGAYPVVRRLTRRIERLQASVDAQGAGDLSARVRVEGRDEVAQLAASFNHSAQRIEALVRAQKDLLANVSHELRSPLARIRMALALLPADTPAAVRDEMNRDVGELDALIEEILVASRLEAGAAETVVDEPVDLAGLCAEECARVGAELELDGAPAAVVLRGDARLLRRLVRNLLENGLRHGGGSAVQARLSRPAGAGPVLEVCDRGPGVPEDERERIFEPFYRVRGASERQGGVGLGLSLARRIAQRHDAVLDCRPREGGGSCFVARFPVARVG